MSRIHIEMCLWGPFGPHLNRRRVKKPIKKLKYRVKLNEKKFFFSWIRVSFYKLLSKKVGLNSKMIE